MNTRRIALCVLPMFVMACALGLTGCQKEARTRRSAAILDSVLSEDRGSVNVEATSADEGFFFGDSTYVWRLGIQADRKAWLKGMAIGDGSDLAMAVSTVESLLQERIPPENCRTVLRKTVNSSSVYVIRGDDVDLVYLLVFTM